MNCSDKGFLDTNKILKQLHILVCFAEIELGTLFHLSYNLAAYNYIDEHESYITFLSTITEKAFPLL